jgi:hypothetical protein
MILGGCLERLSKSWFLWRIRLDSDDSEMEEYRSLKCRAKVDEKNGKALLFVEYLN